MTLRHACSVVAVACAALILSGCFVVSTNLPKGSGPINDDRVVGTWQGIDSTDNKPSDAFLHFLKPDEKLPLRLVWVEDKGYKIYEVTTLRIADKNVFAATIVEPKAKAKEDKIPLGYHLGFYELNANGNEIVFHFLDGKKVGELISKGIVKGIKPPGEYDFATLTGTPDELARFLASPDADAARLKDPAKIRRISTGNRW